MKKAQITLTAIVLFAAMGSTLAIKNSRYTETPLWTLSGTTLTNITIVFGGPSYCATIPFCTTTNRFATDNSPLSATNVKISTQAFVKATECGGTATTLITYTACTTFSTFTTMAQ